MQAPPSPPEPPVAPPGHKAASRKRDRKALPSHRAMHEQLLAHADDAESLRGTVDRLSTQRVVHKDSRLGTRPLHAVVSTLLAQPAVHGAALCARLQQAVKISHALTGVKLPNGQGWRAQLHPQQRTSTRAETVASWTCAFMQDIADGGLGENGDLRRAVYAVYDLLPLIAPPVETKPATDAQWQEHKEAFLRDVVAPNAAHFASVAQRLESEAHCVPHRGALPDPAEYEACLQRHPRLLQSYTAAPERLITAHPDALLHQLHAPAPGDGDADDDARGDEEEDDEGEERAESESAAEDSGEDFGWIVPMGERYADGEPYWWPEGTSAGALALLPDALPPRAALL